MQSALQRWKSEVSSLFRVCLDSNAVIYFLEGQEPYATLVAEIIDRLSDGTLQARMSVISEFELLVAPLRNKDLRALDRIEIFVQQTPNMFVVDVDRVIARRAAEIRAQTGLLAPDAIIAATALEGRCDAIVGNDVTFARRFSRVPHLLLSAYIR